MTFVGIDKPCPACGADFSKRVAVQLATEQPLFIKSARAGSNNLPIGTSVCSICGNVQLFVDNAAFRQDQRIDINKLV